MVELAFRVMLVVLQSIVPLVGVTLTFGLSTFLVIVELAVFVQPLVAVAVTVYVPASLTVRVVPVVADASSHL